MIIRKIIWSNTNIQNILKLKQCFWISCNENVKFSVYQFRAEMDKKEEEEEKTWNKKLKKNSKVFFPSTACLLTTPSSTHWAAGFRGSRDTPVSCSSSWFTTSILVSASMRFCRLWRLSSGDSWKEWTWAVAMFRMWTTWRRRQKTNTTRSVNSWEIFGTVPMAVVVTFYSSCFLCSFFKHFFF